MLSFTFGSIMIMGTQFFLFSPFLWNILFLFLLSYFHRVEQKEIQSELFWDEVYLGSILRAMSFSADQLLELRNSLTIVNMFPNPQTESEYLEFCKKYIQKGMQNKEEEEKIDIIYYSP